MCMLEKWSNIKKQRKWEAKIYLCQIVVNFVCLKMGQLHRKCMIKLPNYKAVYTSKTWCKKAMFLLKENCLVSSCQSISYHQEDILRSLGKSGFHNNFHHTGYIIACKKIQTECLSSMYFSCIPTTKSKHKSYFDQKLCL